jgi:hypothetical protein
MKLAKDCQMLSRRQGVGLTSADLELMFAKEVTIKKKSNNSSLAKRQNPTIMTYSDFLNVLMKVAPKVYPENSSSSVFQKLLLENVLPLAARRSPMSVDEHIEEHSEVHELLYGKVNEGIKAIFEYYTDLSDRRRKKTAALEVQETNKKRGGHGQVVTTSKSMADSLRDAKTQLGYPEYIQFCQDFKLIANAQLTTIEAGDIYLSSVAAHHGGDTARDMTFEEFHECLLRMALTAYKNITTISVVTKVKGLLLFLWKSVNTADATNMAVNGRGNKSVCDMSKSVKSGDLNLFGCSMYNMQMLEVWRKDNFVEYLVAPVPEEESGEDVLKRLLNANMDFMADLKQGLETSDGGSPSVISSTVTTSALGALLKQRPHIAELLYESLADE